MRIQTDQIFAMTGWDFFYWTFVRIGRLRRLAKRVLGARRKDREGKLDPAIAQRFVLPDGRCFRIVSDAGDVELDDRPIQP